MMRPVRLALAPALLVAVGTIAACGGGQATQAPATLTPGQTAGAGQPVAVEAKEYMFTPSALTVPAGSVTFSVKNAGTEEHEFEVFNADGTMVIDEIEGLVPGLTKPLTLTLQPGTYQFMCKLNGHDQLGMKGTITVE